MAVRLRRTGSWSSLLGLGTARAPVLDWVVGFIPLRGKDTVGVRVRISVRSRETHYELPYPPRRAGT